MAANDERKIVGRKAEQLMMIRFTQEEMESFFADGLLPIKLRGNIETLETAPNMTATVDFIDALKAHAREGSLQALADIIEQKNTDLADELLAEILVIQNKLTVDEPTMEEVATLVHREYGTSRRIGPLDQKMLRELLAERIVARRRASYLQLQRSLNELNEERNIAKRKDAELYRQITQMWDFLGEHKIRRTLIRLPSKPHADRKSPVNGNANQTTGEQEGFKSEAAYLDLNTLLQDGFAELRRTLSDIESLRDEKRRLYEVLRESEQVEYLKTEPPYSVITRILQNPARDLIRQQFKLRAVEDRLHEIQLQLTKVKRERPLKVTTRAETDHRLREKIDKANARIEELQEKENLLDAQLDDMEKTIGGSKKKLGFVQRSRTVRLIKRQEREKARARMAAVVDARVAAETVISRNREIPDRPLPESVQPLFSRLSRYTKSVSRSEGSLYGTHTGSVKASYNATDSSEEDDFDSNSLFMSGTMTSHS